MNLSYRDMSQVRSGDIVQYMLPTQDVPSSAGFEQGEIYIVDYILRDSNSPSCTHIYINYDGATDNQIDNFRLLQTYPGSSAEVGDLCIYTEHGNKRLSYGAMFIVTHLFYRIIGHDIGYLQGFSCAPDNCRVICKAADIDTPGLDYYTQGSEAKTTVDIDTQTTRATHPAQRNIGTMFYKS